MGNSKKRVLHFFVRKNIELCWSIHVEMSLLNCAFKHVPLQTKVNANNQVWNTMWWNVAWCGLLFYALHIGFRLNAICQPSYTWWQRTLWYDIWPMKLAILLWNTALLLSRYTYRLLWWHKLVSLRRNEN